MGLAQNDYPKSFINMGIGLGSNYGGFGIKTVTGYKNSGLLVALGSELGYGLGFEVGGQFSYKWWFMNIGYGVYGEAHNLPGDYQLIKGGIVMTGGMINLGKPKRCFIDLAIGYCFGGTYDDTFDDNIKYNVVDGSIGLGFRFGDLKGHLKE